jgi:hypothetical protein
MIRLLTLIAISLLHLAPLSAQFGIRGGCLPGIEAGVELTQQGTRQGRPYYLRLATTDFPNNYELEWVVSGATQGWLIKRDGAPIAINRDNTPTPQLSSNSLYTGIPGPCINNAPEVYSTSPVLPVDWLSFTARAVPGSGIFLDWSTVDERDNFGFYVQRLTDTDWEEIGFVPAGTAGDEGIYRYAFTDDKPVAGRHNYRLVQEDYDGTRSFSDIVSVEYTDEASTLSAYPNPTSGIVHLRGSTSKEGAMVEIVDLYGRTVRQPLPPLPGGEVDLSALPKSTYYLLYRSLGETRTIRILKSY